MGSFCNGDMHMEKKQPVDILKSTEMMVYLTARQAVAEDAALKELLSSYQTKAAMLVASHGCSADMPTEEAVREFIRKEKEEFGEMIARV